MTRNSTFLIVALLLLGAGYAYFFTDWVTAPKIQIEVSTRPSGRPGQNPDDIPTLFMLDREYPIQAVRVIGVSNVPPAELGKPVWQVSQGPKPEPVRGLEYGQDIPGTKPIQKPGKLTPDGIYRIEIQSGRFKGEREFKAPSPAPAPAE
jgi:hypothetical protein